MIYTKERAMMTYGREMSPCPVCGSYHLGYSMPIVMEITEGDTARSLLGKYTRATREGATPLQGPCQMVCRGCGHKGPPVDCSGRTSEDVGKDPEVASKLKDLWNSQTPE